MERGEKPRNCSKIKEKPEKYLCQVVYRFNKMLNTLCYETQAYSS